MLLSASAYYLRPPLVVAPPDRTAPPLLPRVLPPLRPVLNELLLAPVLRLFTLLDVDLVELLLLFERPPRSVAVLLVLLTFVLFERFTLPFVFLSLLFSVLRETLPLVFLVFEAGRAVLPLVFPSR